MAGTWKGNHCPPPPATHEFPVNACVCDPVIRHTSRRKKLRRRNVEQRVQPTPQLQHKRLAECVAGQPAIVMQ